MAQTIQIRRGRKQDLPNLASGELGFCTDTKEVFIGDGAVNTAVGSQNTYTHNQISPAQVWIIEHNLARHPSIIITDSAGTCVMGDITYVSENEVRLNFTAEFAGKAYLN